MQQRLFAWVGNLVNTTLTDKTGCSPRFVTAQAVKLAGSRRTKTFIYVAYPLRIKAPVHVALFLGAKASVYITRPPRVKATVYLAYPPRVEVVRHSTASLRLEAHGHPCRVVVLARASFVRSVKV